MAQGYDADKYVSSNGPRGNGYSWEYDEKAGKWGTRYGLGPGSKFVSAPDEKQPGYRPPEPEPKASETRAAAGPSEYDHAVEQIGDVVGDAFAEGGRQALSGLKLFIAGIIGYAAASTFFSELGESGDPGRAVDKTVRTLLCCLGILALLAALFVYSLVGGGIESPTAEAVTSVLAALGCYSVLGLVRVARGKPFWIDLGKGWRAVRSVKLPKIAYAGIELLAVLFLTKPILMWINSFTIEWAKANQDKVPDSMAIAMGLGMLLVSVIAAALAGLLLCALAKMITGGEK